MSVYNDVTRLETAVRSILDQTYRDLELIAIDDGSTDGSAELLDSLAILDARMRVVHQANTGLTRALIHGCELARGEFIARQDSDDWSHPERIAEQVALLKSNGSIGFVSCATEYVGPRNEHLSIMSRPTDPEAATRGLLGERQGPPAHGSVMFRRSIYHEVGGYREEFHYSQDTDLWLRIAEVSLIGYLQQVRYRHRKEATSISGARRRPQAQFSRLAHQCRLARLQKSPEDSMLDAARELTLAIRLEGGRRIPEQLGGATEIAYLIGSQLVVNRDSRARTYLWEVLRHQPWHFRAWVRLLQSLWRASDPAPSRIDS